MPGGMVLQELLLFLTEAIGKAVDPRPGSNIHYSLGDIVMAAFAVFFSQCPSFLSHQRLMQQSRGMNNAAMMFSVDQLPTDVQIRNVLDEVVPDTWRIVYRRSFEYLQRQTGLERFRDFNNTLLVALDGTGYFYSERIHCPGCTVIKHRDGRISYTHTVLMAAVVKPDSAQVVALEPEFIAPQEGHDKQDCELEAVKRWITGVGATYSNQGITLLGDDIYACTPIICQAEAEELSYIFVAKPQSHKYIYEEIRSFEQLGQIQQLTVSKTEKSKRRHYHYRFINDMALTNAEDAVQVNWVELTITDDSGKQLYRNAFVTNHAISKENVAAVVAAGRCRWKIENEDFNTLKTKGYHFEHNFGHGSSHLSQTLLSLNIIGFLFHTLLELIDEQYALLRQKLPRRDVLFQHIAALTQYLCFASWQSLIHFMLRGIIEGPGPPPDPLSIIE
jgi:hypothetical protein